MFSLALATVVHRQTGSALLTAIAMFGPSMAQMLGATTLMSAADASPPRRTLAVVGALTTASLVLQTMPSLGTTTRLLVVLGAAYVVSIGSGVRWGLLSEVVPPESFPLARSTMNVAVGAFQIVGFAGSGLLLSTFTAPQVFVLAALMSAAAVPAAPSSGSPSARRGALPGPGWRDLAGQSSAPDRAAHAHPGPRALRSQRADRRLRGALRALRQGRWAAVRRRRSWA